MLPQLRILRVPDPLASSSESELRAYIDRTLTTHYELDREIGRGGMGIVYRARDRRLKRLVAIKVLPPELAFRSEIRTRFLREAETAAQLNHPNIVPIHTVDEADHLVFFVMAYVSGENLAKRLHDRGRLDVGEARRILGQVAQALAYAHERGVIHRDIKPDNILLDAETGRPMVTDFGIARAVTDSGDSRLTATGMALGTPAYMSPEQCAGERDIDGRSDLYSLGVVAYQMLTGELPFSAPSTPAMLVKHISERPVPVDEKRHDIPPDLARAVMLLLEKDPANRFPSAAALATALESGNVPALPATAPLSPSAPAPMQGTRPSGGMQMTSPYASPAYPPGYQPLAAPASPASPASPVPMAPTGEQVPTLDEIRRWDAPIVRRFRQTVAPYLFVNAVIVIAAALGSTNFLFVTFIWTIIMAWKYAKLWSEGYDWRDVFRQPRDRQLIDVVSEGIDEVRSLFDPKKRQELRARSRSRRLAAPQMPPSVGMLPPAALQMIPPQYADRLRQAAADRDEIARLIDIMPAPERSRVNEVVPSANALYERAQALALSLADLDRSSAAEAAGSLEAEITRLEAEANPLDHAASEERVRRLAYLKRQRRAIVDLGQRRDRIASKLDSCLIALQNMRFDVLRLRAGTQSAQHVTSLALEALELARNVDSAVYAADQVGRVASGAASGGSGGSARARPATDRA